MSDQGRKNISDKVGEAIKPDSEKSYYEQGKEAVTDSIDKIQAKVQPQSQKSTLQSVSDSVQKGHDDAKAHTQPSLGETASQYVESAKEQIGNVAHYLSESLHGAADSGGRVGEEVAQDTRANAEAAHFDFDGKK